MDTLKTHSSSRRPCVVRSFVTLLALASLVVLAGCSGARTLTGGSPSEASAMRRISSPLTPLAQPLGTHQDIGMRMALSASYGGRTLPLKGNVRMRRGEVIQMAFTAMGVVEVARVEITPESIFLIDRLGKQYTSISYASIPYVGNSLVDYNLIEALLWNELFMPGQKKVAPVLSQFNYEPSGAGQQVIYPKSQKMLSCRFWCDDAFTRLQKTRLQLGQFVCDWAYSGYQTVGDTRYPSAITATLQAAGKQAMADITFSNITLDNKDWQSRTNLANYTKVSPEELLSRLSSF